MRQAAIALLAAICLAGSAGDRARAQDFGVTTSPILVIDQERLFSESRLGERISSQLEQRADELAAENRRIEAELIADELDLTERRAELPPQEFRALADAFDEKVQRLRAQQDAKEMELQERREEERQNFLNRIGPVVSALAQERGAVAILDRRAVFLAAGSIDVTDEAIERLNAAMEPESEGIPPAPEPQPDMLMPGAEGEGAGD